MTRTTCLSVGLLVATGCAAPTRAYPAIERRISYYESRVDRQPLLYPAYALLGAAYFDKARVTHDPVLLRAAREALTQSLDIQPNFPAMKSMAAVCNYAHHFADALVWLDSAESADPADTSLTAMRVEALLALGRIADAQAIVSQAQTAEPESTGSFYLAAASGALAAATGNYDAAEAEFLRAAAAARADNVAELETWALVMAAGAMIDSQNPVRARPHLAAARVLEPENVELAFHEAELQEVEGRPEAALRLYEKVARRGDDPEAYAKAHRLARNLGHGFRARAYFKAAERGFNRAIKEGEVYTLEGLASLYLDAGVKIARAATLALENLRYKRDRSALQLAERARRLEASSAR